jgi:hypothetical protein
MASKNLKTIHIKQLGFIQKFVENVYEKTGEEVLELFYKERHEEHTDCYRFGFSKGRLDLTPFSNMVSGYKTKKLADLEGEEVEVRKTYAKKDNEFVVINKLVLV